MNARDTDIALLRCATQESSVALRTWQKLLEATQLEDLHHVQRRLLPAIWENLSKEHADFPERDRLANLYRHSWAKNARHQKACGAVLERLQAAGIKVLLLKGIALNLTLYENLGTRTAEDFDLLVPFERADEALALLLSDGWESLEEKAQAPSTRLGHATSLGKQGLEFDLHWFALREARDPLWDEELWAQALPISVNKVEGLTLCPNHQLFHLLVNATREPENAYRFLLDLKNFREKFHSLVDLSVVHRMLGERHLLHRLSYLPLELIDWPSLRPQVKPTILDRCWSWCSRNVNDGSGEAVFGVFPFLDYWLHYGKRGEKTLNFKAYLQHHLRVSGRREFLTRLGKKFHRLVAHELKKRRATW